MASLLAGSGFVALIACSTAYSGVDESPESGAAAVDDATFADEVAPDAGDIDAAADAADGADAADPCDDKDKDGYLAVGCDGGDGGGDDCDDDDPRANPGVVGFRTDPPTAKTKGDWNCDGIVTMQYSSGLSCAALPQGSACVAISGFTGASTCGEAGVFDQCGQGTLGLLSCAVASTTTQLQGCR